MKILMVLHGSFKRVTYVFYGVSRGVNEYPIVLQMWFKIFTNNCVQVLLEDWRRFEKKYQNCFTILSGGLDGCSMVVSIVFNPISYLLWPIRICSSYGGHQRSPLRYQWRSHFWPHVAIKHLLLGIFRGHMQKFWQKSKNLSEISGF